MTVPTIRPSTHAYGASAMTGSQLGVLDYPSIWIITAAQCHCGFDLRE